MKDVAWTHNACEACWAEQNPGREAVTLRLAPPERCCFCGRLNRAGIYVRRDGEGLMCR